MKSPEEINSSSITSSASHSDEIVIPAHGNHKKEDTRESSNHVSLEGVPLEGAPLDGNHQKEASKCRICLTEDISHFIFPCGCFILCQHCAGPEQLLRYPQCPHCRTAVHGSFKAGYNTYRSEHITSIIP